MGYELDKINAKNLTSCERKNTTLKGWLIPTELTRKIDLFKEESAKYFSYFSIEVFPYWENNTNNNIICYNNKKQIIVKPDEVIIPNAEVVMHKKDIKETFLGKAIKGDLGIISSKRNICNFYKSEFIEIVLKLIKYLNNRLNLNNRLDSQGVIDIACLMLNTHNYNPFTYGIGGTFPLEIEEDEAIRLKRFFKKVEKLTLDGGIKLNYNVIIEILEIINITIVYSFNSGWTICNKNRFWEFEN